MPQYICIDVSSAWMLFLCAAWALCYSLKRYPEAEYENLEYNINPNYQSWIKTPVGTDSKLIFHVLFLKNFPDMCSNGMKVKTKPKKKGGGGGGKDVE